MKKLLLLALLSVGCDEMFKNKDVYGCTDKTACNYNAAANIFDNTCIDNLNGCGDFASDDIGTYKETNLIKYQTSDCSGQGEELLLDPVQILIFNSDGSATYQSEDSITPAPSIWVQSGNKVTMTCDYASDLFASCISSTYTFSKPTLINQKNIQGICMQIIFTKETEIPK